MAVLEALVVLVGAGLVVYLLLSWLLKATSSPGGGAAAAGPGRWRSAHYDVRGDTRVVVQKLSPDGMTVLDEHTVAVLTPGDADYDDKFLAAMTVARQRQALFESEEG
jgi:hypothetical protein